MAGKSIKGITIEIAGDSSKLVKALDSAQSSVNAVWKNLKQVNSALKMDPGNVDALAKKQELLSKAIAATTERLEAEKAAAEEAKKALELGNISQSEYDQFETQIIKTEASLKDLSRQATETENALKNVGGEGASSGSTNIQDIHDKTELLAKGLEVVAEVGQKAGQVLETGFDAAAKAADLAYQGVEKVAEASVKVVQEVGKLSYNLSEAVVQNYGEFEQLAGGVEKIFGTSSRTVIRNAEQAYRTAGISANQYMQTITGFSASLLQGLEGDTELAAQIADQALQDMSDNANTYGTDIESIINAYQGFAKGNYNMLDNLRLGYGGTKTELIRLINDSGILNERISSLDNISFDQIISAIHAVQDQLNITGTTAREASTTIEGSINALKASYTNFLTGLGRDDVDPTELANELASSFNTVVNNIKPVLRRMSDQIPGLLPQMIGSVEDEIPDAVRVVGLVINTIGRELANSAPELLDILIENLPEGAEIVGELLGNLSNAISENDDKIIQAANAVLPAFVEIGANIVGVLVQSILDNRMDIANAIIDAFAPSLDEAFGEGTADKFREGIQKIVEAAPEVINDVLVPLIDLTGTLMQHLPEIADVVLPLLSTAAEHLPLIVGALVTLSTLGSIAGVASSVIEIVGAVQLLGGSVPVIEGIGTSLSGIGTAASASLSSIGTFAATNAGPLAVLAGEVLALGKEWETFQALMDEAESLGISKTEALAGGFQEIGNQIAAVPDALANTFSSFDNFYENIVGGALSTVDDVVNTFGDGGSHMAEDWALSCNNMAESTQTIEQQAMQVSTDIQLAIEQSGASATASVADDCAIIQSYLDNLEANGQIELHARVVTEYQTIMNQNVVNSSQREMAERYAREGRRNTPEARAVTNYGREMADRYRQQGEDALRAIEETARTAQTSIERASYGGGGGSGGGGGGGSSKSDDDKSALTASKAEELLTSIDTNLSEILKAMGILSEPSEYQNNVNQMIDGVLKALETGYSDDNIQIAMQQLSETMKAFGMDGSVVDATTLEQLRNLVNMQPTQNTEALTQVQGSVAAIQAVTVDYTPHFVNLTGLLGQLLALKQSEESVFNIYVGNELLDTYIQQSLVNQSLVSGGV